MIQNPWIGCGLLAAGTAGTALLHRGRRKIFVRATRVLTFIGEGILTAAACFFLYRTIREFSDVWGSWRGRIWTDSIHLYESFRLKHKLVGLGPEMLRASYAGISDWFGQTVLVSHSEPLQYLLTTGAVGLLLWCGIVGTTIRACRHYLQKGSVCAAFFLPMTAYLGQALVNSTMVTNLALAFVFLGFVRISIDKHHLKMFI